MNSRIILIGLAVVGLSSCSTAYKSGQTPDDVYYSPAKEQDAYVRVEREDDGYRASQYQNSGRYRPQQYIHPEDRWLQMRVRNRYRWSAFDEYDYDYNDWRYSNYYAGYSAFNPYSPWNSCYRWNSYYNPYYPRAIIITPKSNPAAFNRQREFNSSLYANRTYNNTNISRSKTTLRPNYNNSNSVGGSTRRIFSNQNSSRESYYSPSSSSDRPVRTYQPSNSSSNSPSSSGSSRSGSSGSSSGSSGSSSGSRPTRGGN